MNFYPRRTIAEQKARLPLTYQEEYERTCMDRIDIDGNEICGYFEYSFMEEKSYMEQPIRSQDGTIENLEDYTTFLTPRLIIKYNVMNIEDYRTLMRLLRSKNTFEVTCYDIVKNKRVTHEMYFATPQMPMVYHRYLVAMGIQDYTIELIGTNRRLEPETEPETIKFFVQNQNGIIEKQCYEGDTWRDYIDREQTDYQIMYSDKLGRNIVTKSTDGSTAIYHIQKGVFVYPDDPIVKGHLYYETESIK